MIKPLSTKSGSEMYPKSQKPKILTIKKAFPCQESETTQLRAFNFEV